MTSVRIAWLTLALCLLGWLPNAACADDARDIEQLVREGQAEQALLKADAVIASQPRAAPVRFLKGVILSDMNRREQAIEVFVALTQDFPELPDPYNNLAVLYASQGQLQLALQALQQALRNDPHHLAARENLGDVYLALALQAWEAADTTAKHDNAQLKRKLRLAREVIPAPSPAPLPAPKTASSQTVPG